MSPWYYLVVVIEVPVLLALAYAGGAWLYVILAFITLMGMGELYSALIVRRVRPEAAVGYLCALLLLAAAVFAPEGTWAEFGALCLFATAAGSLAAQFARTGEAGRVRDSAATVLGVVYIALPMAMVARLCELDIALLADGMTAGPLKARLGALLTVAAAVWLSDTAAWGIGKTFGRAKLTPRLSPNKTVEGAVAGGIAAVIATVAVGAWAGLPPGHGILLGLLLAVAAQTGDLAESVIKRDLGLDDFGTLLGPHGGMLDTFDGMLFAAPVAYFYLWLLL